MTRQLQNRVTPFGEIVSTPHRGLFMGNRGIIHDGQTRTLLRRRWTTRAWIVCVCDFRGRHREVMSPGTWTELFFLDEGTALAAGHRPCFECRRAEAKAFQAAWASATGGPLPRAGEMDAVLHAERLGPRQPCAPAGLPDGAMVGQGDQAFLAVTGALMPWTAAGYGPPVAPAGRFELLTPPATVSVLRAGYRPVLHPTALAAANRD